MAEDQLLAHLPADLLKVEPPALFLQHHMERHLHQHIAQLLPEHVGIVGVNGLQRLTGLLQEVFPDGGVGLHLVPRTARFRVPQDADDLDKILGRIVLTIRPILHGASLLCSKTGF